MGWLRCSNIYITSRPYTMLGTHQLNKTSLDPQQWLQSKHVDQTSTCPQWSYIGLSTMLKSYHSSCMRMAKPQNNDAKARQQATKVWQTQCQLSSVRHELTRHKIERISHLRSNLTEHRMPNMATLTQIAITLTRESQSGAPHIVGPLCLFGITKETQKIPVIATRQPTSRSTSQTLGHRALTAHVHPLTSISTLKIGSG